MAKLTFNMSVSLDGFVAGPKDEVDQVFAWYFSGDTPLQFPGSPFAFTVSKASAELLREAPKAIGAVITGRRNFNLAGAWNGSPPLGVPHVVVTHDPPKEWVKPGSPFTFVTGGVEAAVRKAKELAGGKDVVVSSPSVMQQCLAAGLLDEINLDLVSVILGEGVPLFAKGAGPHKLERTRIIEGTGVTHMQYRVLK